MRSPMLATIAAFTSLAIGSPLPEARSPTISFPQSLSPLMGTVSPALSSVTLLESTAHDLPGVGGVVPTDTLGRVAAAAPLDLSHLRRKGVLGSSLAGLGIVIPAESAAHDLDQQEQQQQEQPETMVGTTVPKPDDGDDLLNLANIEAVVGKNVLSDSQAEHEHQDDLDNLLDATGLVAVNPDILDLDGLLKRDGDINGLDSLVDATTAVQVDMDNLRTEDLRRGTQLEEEVGDLVQGVELAEVHPDKLGLGLGDLLKRVSSVRPEARYSLDTTSPTEVQVDTDEPALDMIQLYNRASSESRDLADIVSLAQINPDKLELDLGHLLRRGGPQTRDLAEVISLAELNPDKLDLDLGHLLRRSTLPVRDLVDLTSLAEIRPDKFDVDLDRLLARNPMNIADVVAIAEIHPDKFNLDTGRLLGRKEFSTSSDIAGELSSLLQPSMDLLRTGQGKTLRRGESRGREKRRMEAEPYLRRVARHHSVVKRAAQPAPPLFVEDLQANGHFWSGANELTDYDDEPYFG